MKDKQDMPDVLFVDKATATWANYTVTFERCDDKQTEYMKKEHHLNDKEELKKEHEFIIKANQEYQQELIKCIEQMKADQLKAMEEQKSFIECLSIWNIDCEELISKEAVLSIIEHRTNVTMEDKYDHKWEGEYKDDK